MTLNLRILSILILCTLVSVSMTKKTQITMEDSQADQKCFYGTCGAIKAIYDDVSDAYFSDLTETSTITLLATKDAKINLSRTYAQRVINYWADEANKDLTIEEKNTNTEDLKLASFTSKSESGWSYISKRESVDNNTWAQKYINAVDTQWINVNLVSEINALSVSGDYPNFFAEEFKKYLEYRRKSASIIEIYSDLGQCYPASINQEPLYFAELINTAVCERMTYTKVVETSWYISDEIFTETAGIAIGFWAKFSQKLMVQSKVTIFKIHSGQYLIKANLQRDEDNTKITLIVEVTDDQGNVADSFEVINESNCVDVSFNLVIIQRTAENYTLSFIHRSWNNNSRQVFHIANLDASYIENARVVFPASHGIVYTNQIIYFKHFCWDFANPILAIRRELEIISSCFDSSWTSVISDIEVSCISIGVPCTYINEDGGCQVCESGYYIYNQSCIEVCPHGYYYPEDSDDQICHQCEDTECYSCHGNISVWNHECNYCNEGFKLYQNRCVELCSNGTFPVQIQDHPGYFFCKVCVDGCSECNGTNCIGCLAGQILYNNTCIDICPTGWYTSYVGTILTCKQCPFHCNECTGDDNCTVCPSGYFYYNNQCVSVCPDRYFPNTMTGICQHCSSNCFICTNNLVCTICLDGFRLYDGTCVNVCKEGENFSNGICIPCHSNCATCLVQKPDHCTSCRANWYLYNGECYTLCPDGTLNIDGICETCIVNQCGTCTTQSDCSHCFPGFILMNGMCVSSCPLGYYPDEHGIVCIKCNSNCRSCFWEQPDVCTACHPHEYLYHGRCVEICCGSCYTSGVVCLECPERCAKCSNTGVCYDCLDGYYFEGGVCVPHCSAGSTRVGLTCVDCNINFCEKCEIDVNECQRCEYPHILFNGECINVCPSGFYSLDGTCHPCSRNCKRCVDGNTCIDCHRYDSNHAQLYLETGKCVPHCHPFRSPNSENECIPCENASCQACDHELGICTLCPSEYPILYNGSCIANCPEFFVQTEISLTCVPCELPCGRCSSFPYHCTDCKFGYKFELSDGTYTCINECPVGYNMDENNECKLCLDDNCHICTGQLSVCQLCAPGFYLWEGKCLLRCHDRMYIDGIYCKKCSSHCKACFNFGECKICDENYYLLNGHCVATCGPNHVINYETHTCVHCIGCVSCNPTQPDYCTICKYNEVLYLGECLFDCPSGTAVNNNNECVPCSVNSCVYCNTNVLYCEVCSHGLILYMNQCIPGCPFGTRPIVFNGYNSCEVCISHCRECSTSTGCDICHGDGWYLNIVDQICYYGCPAGYYRPVFSNECHACHESCSVCTTGIRCENCVFGFYLWADYTCHAACPVGWVEIDGICKKCLSNCTSCLGSQFETICSVCDTGYYIDINGTCVKVCSSPNYFTDKITGYCEPCSYQCSFCLNNDVCYTCASGYRLVDGHCKDNCQNNEVVNANHECVACLTSDLCRKCNPSDLHICIECYNPNHYIYEGKCIGQCPTGFYQTVNHECVKCSVKNCDTCASNIATCDKCLLPFVLHNNLCVLKCPVGWVTVGNYCHRCPDGCRRCNSNFECIVCESNLYISNIYGKITCVSTCPDGFYGYDGHCNQCHSTCATCENEHTCLVCTSGFVLLNGVCVEFCPDFFVRNAEGVCISCHYNCLECNSNDTDQCIICEAPYVLHGTVCLSTCDEGYVNSHANPRICVACPHNCLQCDPYSLYCVICKPGFNVTSEGTCIPVCLEGYIAEHGICKPCVVDHCDFCLNPHHPTCDECLPPYFLTYNNNLEKVCTLKCEANQWLFNGQCVDCHHSCSTCSEITGYCITCPTGYHLVNNICVVIGCKNGQVLFNGICHNCSVSSCETCFTIDKCDHCVTGYFLHNNTCVSNCPYGYFVDENEHIVCITCIPNCHTCYASGHCDKCNDPYVFTNGQCILQCPSGSVNYNGVCITCADIRCHTCDIYNPEKCTYCVEPYTLKHGKCVANCGYGYYITIIGDISQCAECYTGCNYCPHQNECYECLDGYVKIENQCLPECTTGYIRVGNECKKCWSNDCLTCVSNDLSICISCAQGLYLLNGKCVKICPLGYYVSITHHACHHCNYSCYICTSSDVCDVCLQGWVLFNGICYTKCPDGTVDENGICRQCGQTECEKCSAFNIDNCEGPCQSGSLLDGHCVTSCPEGYYLDSIINACVNCERACNECTSATNCVLCKPEFHLQNGDCVTKCPAGKPLVNGICTSCEIPSCGYCTTSGITGCDECKSGYYLIHAGTGGYTVVTCVQECPVGWYSSNFVCYICSSGCGVCENTNTCTQCAEDYHLYHGLCIQTCPIGTWVSINNGVSTCIICTEPNCISCSGNICETCLPGFYLYDGTCIQSCPIHWYPIASICNECEDNCQKCTGTYCIVCHHDYILHNGICIDACPTGFVHYNGFCNPCNDHCSSCFPNLGHTCEVCVTPYVLWNGTCISICPNATYVDIIDGIHYCAPCDAGCLKCTGHEHCTGPCVTGLVLHGNICVNECNEGWVQYDGACYQCTDYNCDVCNPQNLNYCHKCQDPYFLLNGMCVKTCGYGFYENHTTLTCVPCYGNCQVCTHLDHCSICLPGMCFLEGTTICDFCPSNYLVIGLECVSCKVEFCDKCNPSDPNVCIECEAGYINYNGVCIKTCPYEYYMYQNVCIHCNTHCGRCEPNGTCFECKHGFILFGLECIPECPAHYVEIIVNHVKVCQKCSDHVSCITCKQYYPEICTFCVSGTVMQNGKCVKECPIGHYLLDRVCVKCGTNCLSCNVESCEYCNDGYFLWNGVCVNICPQGYYSNGHICYKCTDGCLSCPGNICDICLLGQWLHNNICYQTCPVGYYGYNGICIACTKGCRICHSADTCDECLPEFALNAHGVCVKDCGEGYTFYQGRCFKCQDPDCAYCQKEDPSKCNICITKIFDNINYTCIATCPFGYIEKVIRGRRHCVKCNPKCKTCQTDDIDICTSCPVGLILHSGHCINECPIGTRKYSDRCVACAITNCSVCATPEQEGDEECLQCLYPGVLLHGICLYECSAGYYLTTYITFNSELQIGQAFQCTTCGIGCNECNSQGTCVDCRFGYFLHEGVCTHTCPDGWYGDCEDHVCVACHHNCLDCVGPSDSDCLNGCSGGNYLSTTGCVTWNGCPSGTFPDSNTWACVTGTISYCDFYSSANSCRQCLDHYIMRKGICVVNPQPLGLVSQCLLLTPLSGNYAQDLSYNLFDYSYGIGSTNFSIAFHFHALGHEILGANHTLLSLIDDEAKFKFEFIRSTNNFLIKINGTHTQILTANLNYITENHFVSFTIEDDGDNLNVTVYTQNGSESLDDETKFTFTDVDFIITSKFSIDFHTANNSYKVCNVNIGDFVFTPVLINKYSFTTNFTGSWIGEYRLSTGGYIPLSLGFHDYDVENPLVYNLYDLLSKSSTQASSSTWGLRTLLYFGERNTANVSLVKVSLNYDSGSVVIVHLKANVENALGSHSATNLNSSIKIEADSWYWVTLNVTKNTDGASTVSWSILDSTANKLDSGTGEYGILPYLFIDATVSLAYGSIGQAFDAGLLINGPADPETVLPLVGLVSVGRCAWFSKNFRCKKCAEDEKLTEEGQCIMDPIGNAKVYSTHLFGEALTINAQDKSTFKFYFKSTDIKKHSGIARILTQTGSIETSEGLVIADILSQNLEENYETIKLGEVKVHQITPVELHEWAQVVVRIDGKTVKVNFKYGSSDSTEFTNESAIDQPEFNLKLRNNSWINQYLYPTYYPGLLSDEEVDQLLAQNVQSCDPTCLDCDYYKGDCLTCEGKPHIGQNSNPTICKHSIMGFKYVNHIISSNYSLYNASECIHNISDKIPVPTFSRKYGVFGYITLFIREEDQISTEYNLLRLRNGEEGAHKIIDLIAIKQGPHVHSFKIIIHSRAESIEYSVPEDQVRAFDGDRILFTSQVDVINKSFNYELTVNHKAEGQADSSFSKTETLSDYPVELLSSGQLIAFGVGICTCEGYTQAKAEAINTFVIPNLSDYDRIVIIFKTSFVPILNEPIENCQLTSGAEKPSCAFCFVGYEITEDGQCQLTHIELPQTPTVCPTFDLVDSDFEFPDVYALSEPGVISINYSVYFRINFNPVDSNVDIYNCGDSLKVTLSFNEGTPQIIVTTASGGNTKTIDSEKLYQWGSLNVELVDGNLAVRVRIESDIALEHFENDFSGDLQFCKLNDGKGLCQLYGAHISNQITGAPVISYPTQFDCGCGCFNCKEGVCYDSDSEDGETQQESRYLGDVRHQCNARSLALNNYFLRGDNLRSRKWSIKFAYRVLKYKNLQQYGDDAHTSQQGHHSILRVNLNGQTDSTKQHFVELSFDNVGQKKFTLAVKGSWVIYESGSLDFPPVNESVNIVISINDDIVSVSIYDHSENNVVINLTLDPRCMGLVLSEEHENIMNNDGNLDQNDLESVNSHSGSSGSSVTSEYNMNFIKSQNKNSNACKPFILDFLTHYSTVIFGHGNDQICAKILDNWSSYRTVVITVNKPPINNDELIEYAKHKRDRTDNCGNRVDGVCLKCKIGFKLKNFRDTDSQICVLDDSVTQLNSNDLILFLSKSFNYNFISKPTAFSIFFSFIPVDGEYELFSVAGLSVFVNADSKLTLRNNETELSRSYSLINPEYRYTIGFIVSTHTVKLFAVEGDYVQGEGNSFILEATLDAFTLSNNLVFSFSNSGCTLGKLLFYPNIKLTQDQVQAAASENSEDEETSPCYSTPDAFGICTKPIVDPIRPHSGVLTTIVDCEDRLKTDQSLRRYVLNVSFNPASIPEGEDSDSDEAPEANAIGCIQNGNSASGRICVKYVDGKVVVQAYGSSYRKPIVITPARYINTVFARINISVVVRNKRPVRVYFNGDGVYSKSIFEFDLLTRINRYSKLYVSKRADFNLTFNSSLSSHNFISNCGTINNESNVLIANCVKSYIFTGKEICIQCADGYLRTLGQCFEAPITTR